MSSILNSSYTTFDLARAVVANHDPRTKQTTDKAAYSHQVSVSFNVELAGPESGAGGTRYNMVVLGLHRGIEQVDKVDLCSFHANRGARRYEIQCMYPRMVMKYEDGSFTMNVRVASLEFRAQLDFDKIIHMIEDLGLKYKPFITQKGQPVPRGSTAVPYALGPGPQTPVPYRSAYTASPVPSPSGFGSPAFDFGISERAFSPTSQAFGNGLGQSGYQQYNDHNRSSIQSSPLKNDAFLSHFGGHYDTQSQHLPASHESLHPTSGTGSQALPLRNPFPGEPTAYSRRPNDMMPSTHIPGLSSTAPQHPPSNPTPPVPPPSYGSELSIPSTPMRMLEASRAKEARSNPTASAQASRLACDIDGFLPPPRTLPFQPAVNQLPTTTLACDESTADEGDSDEELKKMTVPKATSKTTKSAPGRTSAGSKKGKRASEAADPLKVNSPKKKAKASPKKTSPSEPMQIKSPPPKPKCTKPVQTESPLEDKMKSASEKQGPSKQFNEVLTSLLMCPGHMLAAIEQNAPWLLGQNR